MKKRIIAGVLAAVMTFGLIVCPTGQSTAYASELTENVDVTDATTEIPESEEIQEDVESTENAEEIITESTEDTEEQGEIITESTEDTEEQGDIITEKTHYIQYLMMGSEAIGLSEIQKIVVGLGCDMEIASAALKYHNLDTNEEYEQEYSTVVDGALLFELSFSAESFIGKYQIDSVTYTIENNNYEESFAEAGIDATFGVEETVENNPDAIVEESSSETNTADIDVVRIDEEGNYISEESISNAIDEAYADSVSSIATYSLEENRNKDLIVVLDPGHDNTHKGTSGNGIQEETVNLKIATYCKEALEKYSGVKVYMTRSTENCPYPGTTSGNDNENRVKFAANIGADIYISIHNNAAQSSAAHGAMVFYPNKNYNPSVSQEGKGLAEVIEKNLVALGLYNRGVTVRNAKEDKYPDGSAADYYGVIRNAKLAGIPAIIVEHAFVTNYNDAEGFLSSELKLKKLGEADAAAIAEYYGLGTVVKFSADSVKIANVDNTSGTALMSVWGVQPAEKVKKISFAVWSKEDKSDLKWYDVNGNGATTYAAELNIKNHNYNVGKYYIDVYAYDTSGKSCFLGGTTCNFSKNVSTVTASTKDEVNYEVKMTGVSIPGGFKGIKYAVWSEKNDKDDLIWYESSLNQQGYYIANVSIKNHKTAGKYYVDAYAVKENNQIEYVGGTTFQVSDISGGKVSIENMNYATGEWDVVVSDIVTPAGVKTVQIPAWNKNDKSDVYWYNAEKQKNGTYVAHIRIKNHNNAYGKYMMDVYVTANNEIQKCINSSSTELRIESSTVEAYGNSTETDYTIKISNIKMQGTPVKAKAAVWSKNNWQDDLVWYTADKGSDGRWYVNVPISRHKTAGLYYADVYIEDINGNSVYAGGTTFNVSDAQASGITILNYNKEEGTFDVVVNDVNAKAGIKQVKIPVWSKEDHSDIYWYVAEKQGGGSYIAHVDISNHQFHYGKYYVDAYAVSNTDIQSFLCGTNINVKEVGKIIKASGNEDESSYTVTIKNIGNEDKIKEVKVAVWSKNGGQDDLLWYKAEKNEKNTWKTNIPIIKHKTAGLYYADVYVTDINNQSNYAGGTTFQVGEMSIKGIKISNKDNASGTFNVTISGVESKSGVKQIKVPVWSKEDHSDLYWYEAKKQADGTYAIQANIKNHQYNYGKYYVDTYGVTQNGIEKFLGGTTVVLNAPTAVIKATANKDESQYNIAIDNLGLAGGIKDVKVAVWSQIGGQDDLAWYAASNIESGSWKTTVEIARHKTIGTYYADVYATNSAGKMQYVGGTTFTVDGIEGGSVSIRNVNNSAGSFDVVVDDVTSNVGIKMIKVAVWSSDDHADLYWYTASQTSNGSYVANVNISNHQYNYGNYYVDVYGYAKNNTSQFLTGTRVEMKQPTAVIKVSGNEQQTIFNMSASNVGNSGGVKEVRVAVWSETDGQDDLMWYTAEKNSTGTWSANIPIVNHKTAGKYYADVYATSFVGKSVYLGGKTFNVEKPTADSVKVINHDEANGTFGVEVSGIHAKAGVNKIQIAVWSSKNQNDLRWYDAITNGDGTYKINVSIVDHQKNTGLYYADAYLTDNNGIEAFVGGVTCSMVNVTSYYHPIEGNTSVTIQQMVDYYRARATYPAFYANTEAATIEDFCRIYQEECKTEGIRAEVAFCQAMKETGFLRYGGNVKIEQYNFAGMGSTGAGVAGESYPDVRTGIRAQVQHLKAYANNDPLKNACVDSRFKYVSRGTAPYVEWLGIQENPYHKGWATAKNYGYDIVGMINNLKTY